MKRAGTPLVAAAAVAIVLFGLAATAGAHPVTGRIIPHVFVGGQAPPTTAACQANIGIACYAPFQLQKAYDLNSLYSGGWDGTGSTIAIVDSFGSPTAEADLAQFDADFGLPASAELQDHPSAGKVPPFDPSNGDMVNWAVETSLDVQWAHAIARGRTSCWSRRRSRRPRASTDSRR